MDIKAFTRNENGFTLLETLLTLAILGVLLVIVLTAMRLGVRSWEKGAAAIEEGRMKRNFFSMLSDEISSMYPYRQKERMESRYVFIGANESLGFVTTIPGNEPGLTFAGARWVYYSVRENGLTVREKIITSTNVEDDTGGNLIELEPDIEKVSFEYMGEGGWENGWDADSKKSLPKMIKALIKYKNGRNGFGIVSLTRVTADENK